MNSTPETIPIERFIALDLRKHYIMVGGEQNQEREWVLRPRKVLMPRFRQWAGFRFSIFSTIAFTSFLN